VGILPVAPIAGTLATGNADQRTKAAVVLADHIDLVSPAERHTLLTTLIAAMSDSNIQVREFLARPLRDLRTPQGQAALARALERPDATDQFFWQATGQRRPLAGGPPQASAFPPATVAAVSAVAPNFLAIVGWGDSRAVRELVAAIDRSSDPNTTPLLVWLLVNGDVRDYGGLIQDRLTRPSHVTRLPIGELIDLLPTTDADHRVAIIDVFDRLFRLKARPEYRERMITALMGRLDDPHIDVRRRALETLSIARANVPLRALTSMFERPDVTAYFATQVIRTVKATNNPDALPVLERWARSASTQTLRDEAAMAYITVARPANPAREAWRLLWEPPSTALERQVLAEGRRALPLAWRALSSRSIEERRAAAALLGWFPDRDSIGPILTALDGSPGALTREQLLFDLNMTLLLEGTAVPPDERNVLASTHLRWLYDQISTQPTRQEIRTALLSVKPVAVFPDRVGAPFSAEMPSFSATAVRSESPDAFRQWIAKSGSGVAFHAITSANGLARVATTVYVTGAGASNQLWIGLYRREGDRWVPLPAPPHVFIQGNLNGPNVRPTIRRDYGEDDPAKILRLDLLMERVRVDLTARQDLRNENRQYHNNGMDASYVSLLERYTHSDSLSVRVAAHYEVARLTGQPDVPFWMDTLAQQSGTPHQAIAQGVIAQFAFRDLETHGREPAGAEREQLVAAALAPRAVDRALLPKSLPQTENIREVRRSGRFGLVAVVYGSAPLGMSGYSMLFERRGDDWIFLCVVKTWIS
jgi:HEAT repeat protein